MKLKFLAILIPVLLAACSTGAKRVDCTWRLEPINAPSEQTREQKK